MQIVNLTPHAIVIRLADGSDRTIPPSGQIARMAMVPTEAEPVAGVPTVKTVFGEVVGLPPAEEGVVFVTSTPLAQRVARADVMSPDTGPTAIRVGGQIVAVRGLQRFA